MEKQFNVSDNNSSARLITKLLNDKLSIEDSIINKELIWFELPLFKALFTSN